MVPEVAEGLQPGREQVRVVCGQGKQPQLVQGLALWLAEVCRLRQAVAGRPKEWGFEGRCAALGAWRQLFGAPLPDLQIESKSDANQFI